MAIGIVSFPGSVGVEELKFLYERTLGQEVRVLAYTDESIRGIDVLVLPGGAAFGDAVRPGAIARLAPIAPSIRRFSRSGRVLGIGNGFQILCELNVLKGTFLPNPGGRFVTALASMRVETQNSYINNAMDVGSVLTMPLSCYCGAYYADHRTTKDLDQQHLIVARYCDPDGSIEDETPSYGCVSRVAALTNPEGNVVGIMAHPERATEPFLGSQDGVEFLRATLP